MRKNHIFSIFRSDTTEEVAVSSEKVIAVSDLGRDVCDDTKVSVSILFFASIDFYFSKL